MSSTRSRVLHLLLIAATATLPFLPSISGPFIFDDVNVIVQNPYLDRINLDLYFSDARAFSVKTGNWPYRPLMVAVNAGLKTLSARRQPGVVSSPYFHLFQLGLHLLASILVYLVAGRAFGLRLGALVAALAFAAAPLQTQAVAYISARSMGQAAPGALFALLALAMARAAKDFRPVFLWQAAAIAGAGWAFFSSEGSLVLLLWIGLWMFAAGVSPGEPKLRHGLIGIAAMAVVYLVLKAVCSPGLIAAASPLAANQLSRVENAMVQMAFPFVAARLFLWPNRLNFLHHAVGVEGGGDWFWLSAPGVVILVVLIWALRRRRTLAAGLAWYLGALLPASVVPLNVTWAEHRSYLALVGLCLVVGKLLESLTQSFENAGARRRAFAIKLMAALALAGFVALSHARAGVWSGERSVYFDAARKSPSYEVIWNFLADLERRDARPDAAIRDLRLAIRLNPKFADAHAALAAMLLDRREFDEALAAAHRAVELDPQNATYWNNLGTTLWGAGDLESAKRALTTALERASLDDPNRPIYEKNLARLLAELQTKPPP